MKRRTKRFDDGGDVNEEFKRPIKSTDDAKSETAAAPKKTSFSSAFAAARAKALKGGPKTFEWEGKKYGTAMKGETKAKPAKASSGSGVSSSVIDAGVAAAEAQRESRNPNSPRLSSILNVRNRAGKALDAAAEKNTSASEAEQNVLLGCNLPVRAGR
jgi:hypothetical protein